jgi:RecQ family ATP-dependent DNA helicase
MAMIEEALVALHRYFGFEDFREGQREVISAILEGQDTVVVMPTGGGKSLCYQLPALMKEGATVVVSPLIALMKDQVDALLARNLPATFINSSITFEEQKERIRGVRQGRYKLVYVAPERFRSAHFVETLRGVDISLFAVDEAHCISQWGHDFRPDYLRLKQAIEEIGRPQITALTATATPYVRSDIIDQLQLKEPRAFVSGFDRPNLSISVLHTQKEREKIAHIKRLASATGGGSGIIYTSTRKAVEQVTARLRTADLNVVAYHAGMEDAERTRAQDLFMTGRAQMIVATNAFGMGIDKADIRFVAHYQMPGSIEAYYQEIGRAALDLRAALQLRGQAHAGLLHRRLLPAAGRDRRRLPGVSQHESEAHRAFRERDCCARLRPQRDGRSIRAHHFREGRAHRARSVERESRRGAFEDEPAAGARISRRARYASTSGALRPARRLRRERVGGRRIGRGGLRRSHRARRRGCAPRALDAHRVEHHLLHACAAHARSPHV